MQDGTGKANEILGNPHFTLILFLLINITRYKKILKQFLSSADTVMNIYIKAMAEDDDKEVVAQACLSIADIMKDYGYVAIQNCGCLFSSDSVS